MRFLVTSKQTLSLYIIVRLVDSGGIERQIRQGWDSLPSIQLDEDVKKSFETIDFWHYVCRIECEGRFPYFSVGVFALFVISTLHANADLERTFSAQNNFNTKNRNNL